MAAKSKKKDGKKLKNKTETAAVKSTAAAAKPTAAAKTSAKPTAAKTTAKAPAKTAAKAAPAPKAAAKTPAKTAAATPEGKYAVKVISVKGKKYEAAASAALNSAAVEGYELCCVSASGGKKLIAVFKSIK